MRGHTGARAIAASPTLVGAMTVLIVTVAVFLAYNANQGLPFTPVYRLSAEVPNANTLVPGNEVRIGGVRAGVVETVEPELNDDGTVNARLGLSLDRDVNPLPVDSTIIIRSRSALGLKYLEIVRGDSGEGHPEGSTIALSQARPEPVEIDEVFNVFDDPTRSAIRANLREFGDALAGRGGDLNQTIGRLPELLRGLEPVMGTLASRGADLDGFVRGLAAAAAEAAPVADQQGRLFVSLERTFEAFADVARPYIQETISESPPTLEAVRSDLPVIRPFLTHTSQLFAELQPGAASLRDNAGVLADAIVAGRPALRRAPRFNAQLPPTTQALVDLANDGDAREGIADLTDFGRELRPALAFIGPAQSICNYGTLLFRNASSMLSLGDGIGTGQRFIALNPPTGTNSEGTPSSTFASGGGQLNENFLHYNPYPNTASAGQSPIECEAGNEPWLQGRAVIGNVPGNQGIATGLQTAAQRNRGARATRRAGG